MGREIKTLDDILNEKAAGPIPVKKEQKRKKKNKKGIIIAAIALIMAAVTAISCYVFKKKKSADTEIVPSTTIESQVAFDDIGKELEQPENPNSQYGKTTGDVDPDKIVEKDGVIYVDQDSADKADQVGQTKIDLQNGKLEVKPNGEVHEKEPGYEVKDENGNTIETGSNESGIPDGYITLDRNYYYKDGSLAFSKGDIVDESEFNSLKHLLITDPKNAIKVEETTKPAETTKPVETTKPSTTQATEAISQDGKVNSNGTYTIYGVTYMDKATFEAFILDDNSSANFGYYNGVIYPVSVINQKANQK